MKRIFSILLPVLLLSCSRVDLPLKKDGLCISVAIPGTDAAKAAADSDGDGRHADRCRLQVWLRDSLCYDRTAAVENMHARFDVILDENPDYLFLFWADNTEGNYYDTDTLSRVRFNPGYRGCDDARDAFCRCMTATQVKEIGDGWILLGRPFGQVNVITDDIDDLAGKVSPGAGAFLPETVRVTFNAPSEYDVATGKVSAVREFTYSAPVYSIAPAAENTLVMDYILASEEKSVLNMKVSLQGAIEPIDIDIANLPLQRNWRTNARGSLLTGKVQAGVRIDSRWMGEVVFP